MQAISPNATKATTKSRVLIRIIVFRLSRSHQDRLAQLAQIQKIIITTIPIDLDLEEAKPSKRPKVLLDIHFKSQLLYNYGVV